MYLCYEILDNFNSKMITKHAYVSVSELRMRQGLGAHMVLWAVIIKRGPEACSYDEVKADTRGHADIRMLRYFSLGISEIPTAGSTAMSSLSPPVLNSDGSERARLPPPSPSLTDGQGPFSHPLTVPSPNTIYLVVTHSQRQDHLSVKGSPGPVKSPGWRPALVHDDWVSDVRSNRK